MTVATGADATLTAGSISADSARRRALATTPLPAPLAQVELSNNYTGNLTWLAITMQLTPGSVPAGRYPATITTSVVLGDGQTSTSVSNFVAIVSPTGALTITGSGVAQVLAILTADTTGLLTIYPAGTVLPSPSPTSVESPTPSPSSTPAPTATPTSAPSPTPAPTRTPTPNPSPTPTTSAPPDLTVALSQPCYYAGYAGNTITVKAIVTGSVPPGYTLYYGWSIGWPFTVPGGGFQFYNGYAGLEETVGSQPTATVTVPSFAPGTGQGALIEVLLLERAPGSQGGINTILPLVYAQGSMPAGDITCADS